MTEEELRELLQTCEIAIFHPQPGDTIILTSKTMLTGESAARIRKLAALVWPDNKCVVLEGLDASVLRQGEGEEKR